MLLDAYQSQLPAEGLPVIRGIGSTGSYLTRRGPVKGLFCFKRTTREQALQQATLKSRDSTPEKLSITIPLSVFNMEGKDCRNLAERSLPRSLILGHSFVRRMKDFLKNNTGDSSFNEHFDLKHSCLIKLIGNGGRTVEKLVRFDLTATRATNPDILVLEIGSNDLCDPSVDPEILGETITAFVDVLQHEIRHKFTVICQVIPRLNPPFPTYNRRVKKLNKCLRDTLADSCAVKFWRHRGLNNPTRNIYVRDGIHLNKRGHKALYRSYRGALLYALKQIQHNQSS